LATFIAKNPDDKADNPEPKALANNQGQDINANISNSENPNLDNLSDDEHEVGGGKRSISLEPENSDCTKRLRSWALQAGLKNKSKVPADVISSFKSHVIEIKKGSDIVQGWATFAANNLMTKPTTQSQRHWQTIKARKSMSTSPIRRILTQITYLKMSRKSAVGKVVFHSSLKTLAAQSG